MLVEGWNIYYADYSLGMLTGNNEQTRCSSMKRTTINEAEQKINNTRKSWDYERKELRIMPVGRSEDLIWT